jgi:hypothetical protein
MKGASDMIDYNNYFIIITVCRSKPESARAGKIAIGFLLSTFRSLQLQSFAREC